MYNQKQCNVQFIQNLTWNHATESAWTKPAAIVIHALHNVQSKQCNVQFIQNITWNHATESAWTKPAAIVLDPRVHNVQSKAMQCNVQYIQNLTWNHATESTWTKPAATEATNLTFINTPKRRTDGHARFNEITPGERRHIITAHKTRQPLLHVPLHHHVM
jgi:hypothetical protein